MQAEAFNGAGNRWANGSSAHPGRQAEKYHGKMSNKCFPSSIYHPCSFLAPGKWPWTRLEWLPPHPKASPTGQGCSGWESNPASPSNTEIVLILNKEPNENVQTFPSS